MRVSQGGHDVPDDKLLSRYLRTISNLQAAIERLPHVLIFDNSDLNVPYRHVAAFDQSRLRHLQEPIPAWLQAVIPQKPDYSK
jgi:predicted ABC-type ATPase